MKNLAEFINECGSVAEAARRLDISRQTLDRWRSGKFKPSRAMIRLAEVKGVDLKSSALPDTKVS